MSNNRGFLRWLQGKTGGNGTAQMQGESLIRVPDTADCFRAIITALRSIAEGKGVFIPTPSPEERTVRLLVKNLGRKMPESDVSVLQLRSKYQEAAGTAKDRPLTPH